MVTVNEIMKEEVREVVLDFFAEECEINVDEITDDSNIISDLGGEEKIRKEIFVPGKIIGFVVK